MTKALVLGIGGQDGSYLADLLLERGYTVHGMVRHSSCDNLWRLKLSSKPSIKQVQIHKGDMLDGDSVNSIIHSVKPEVIYNVADMDNVDFSYICPNYTNRITYQAPARLFHFLATHYPEVRIFQPLSATMFGKAAIPQTERTPLDPESPYACAKAALWQLCQYYREIYRLDIRCGIMYNHDSPRRKEGYLLQKICRAAAQANLGQPVDLTLQEIRKSPPIDIGYARDAMSNVVALMEDNQGSTKGIDCLIGTGKGYTIGDLLTLAFHYVDKKWQDYVREVEGSYRPGGDWPIWSGMVPDITHLRSTLKNSFTCPIYMDNLIDLIIGEWQRRLGS